ncbi:variable surface lipoprotein, partial [Mesomycoplasma hyorhinis]
MKKSIFSKKLLVSFGSLVTLAAIPLIAISCGQTNTDQSQQPGSGSTTGGQSGTTTGTGSTTGGQTGSESGTTTGGQTGTTTGGQSDSTSTSKEQGS